MKSFSTYVIENFGGNQDFGKNTPHHSYKTEDGHKIEVHIINRLGGKSAVFFNKNLGHVTKIAHWSLNAQEPSKSELQSLGHDIEEEDQNQRKLLEKFSPLGAPLGYNAAGKISEHSTTKHLIDLLHKQNGTHNSPEHLSEIKPHLDAIAKEAAGANKKEVETRVEHGRIAAHAIHETIKQNHGEQARITRIGHTANAGDIGRFTKGKHDDTQENPSDVAVEISNSHHNKGPDEKQYEGFSLKSSKKSDRITAKNPAIHLDGKLDHARRKLNTDAVSRTGLSKVHELLGVGHLSQAQRSKMLDSVRKKEGTNQYAQDKNDPDTKTSSLELATNELARPAKTDVAKEFHEHLQHLTNSPEGHQMIGNMLKSHLTAQTSMPWNKVHIKGDTPEKSRVAITAGSESGLNNIFNNKNSKYAVKREKDRVTISHIGDNGTENPIAHYSPKTKSNPFKENVHGWNVLPAKMH